MSLSVTVTGSGIKVCLLLLFYFAPTEEQETLDYILHNDGKPLTMLEQSEVIKRLLNFGWKVPD